jgi:dTDP-4-dehydrorhamnose 3,5-epimerase
MRFISTEMPGLVVIEPRVCEDGRGFFFESYRQAAFRDAGITFDFVQDNHSRSNPGLIRGLHFQAPPCAQDKLVRVISGSILDVVVDIRHGSPSFGKCAAFELSDRTRRMLFVPKGCAHGFCVLGDQPAETLYKCSEVYAPDLEFGIRWDDPGLDIDWPVKHPSLSERDRRHPVLADLSAYFGWELSRG